MSGKSSPANEGIVNTGNGNVQSAGKTDYAESKWTLSAPPSGVHIASGRAIPSFVNNKGIINTGHGNVQAAGETNYESSKWDIKMER